MAYIKRCALGDFGIEEQSVKHAKNFCNLKNSTTKIVFRSQLKTNNIKDIVQKAMASYAN